MARVKINDLETMLYDRFCDLLNMEDTGEIDEDLEREFDALSAWVDVYEDYCMANLDIISFYSDNGIEFEFVR